MTQKAKVAKMWRTSQVEFMDGTMKRESRGFLLDGQEFPLRIPKENKLPGLGVARYI
jgi:hypothetical protein